MKPRQVWFPFLSAITQSPARIWIAARDHECSAHRSPDGRAPARGNGSLRRPAARAGTPRKSKLHPELESRCRPSQRPDSSNVIDDLDLAARVFRLDNNLQRWLQISRLPLPTFCPTGIKRQLHHDRARGASASSSNPLGWCSVVGEPVRPKAMQRRSARSAVDYWAFGSPPGPTRHAKSRIGCNSMAFGSTPVCPGLKSKKATPTTRA